MKRPIVILLFINLTLCSNITQNYVYQYGTIMWDSLSDIVVTDSEIYVTGSTAGDLYGPNAGDRDVIVIRYDHNFTVQQGVQWGDFGRDEGFGLYLHPNQNILYVTWTHNETDSTISALYANNFTTYWNLSFFQQTDFNDIAYDITSDTLWVAGATEISFPEYSQTNQGQDDPILIQLSPYNGTVLFLRLYGTTDYEYFESLTFYQDSNNAIHIFAVGAVIISPDYASDHWVVSISPNGTLEHSTSFGASLEDDGLNNVEVSNNSLILLGYSTASWTLGGINYEGTGAMMMSMDPNTLDLNWVTWWNNDSNIVTLSRALSVQNGTVLAAGSIYAGPSDPFGFDVWIAAVDPTNGKTLAYNFFGSADDDTTSGMFAISNLAAWVAGSTDGDFGGAQIGSGDLFILSAKVNITKDDDQNFASSSSPETGLSSAQKIGIIVGVIGGALVLGGAIVGVVVVMKTRRRNSALDRESTIPESQAMPREQGKYSTRYEMMVPVQGSSSDGMTASSSQDNSVSSQQTVNSKTESNRPISTLVNDWLINYNEIKLESKIGQGAFGEVFKGKYRGGAVAVKQMILTNADDVKINDFFAEAELMKGLRPHPNITQLLGVCTDPLCIVTEFVANGSLYSWLHSTNPLDDSTKYEIMKGTAAGMLHLHRQGVIHRDLAARNILLDKAMVPKVADFGLSRIAIDNATNKTEASVGPIKWMAPEALIERTYNQKTDVWSFGVVVFELLTREVPYKNYNLMQIGASVGVGKLSLVPEIEQREQDFSPRMVALLKKCLQYQAEERPSFQQIVEWTEENPEQQ